VQEDRFVGGKPGQVREVGEDVGQHERQCQARGGAEAGGKRLRTEAVRERDRHEYDCERAEERHRGGRPAVEDGGHDEEHDDGQASPEADQRSQSLEAAGREHEDGEAGSEPEQRGAPREARGRGHTRIESAQADGPTVDAATEAQEVPTPARR
jgi:hypothetical protein